MIYLFIYLFISGYIFISGVSGNNKSDLNGCEILLYLKTGHMDTISHTLKAKYLWIYSRPTQIYLLGNGNLI